jgi:hypothetical protein
MSNTITVRLSEDLLRRLREKSRRTGLPVGRVVRESLESTLGQENETGFRGYRRDKREAIPMLSPPRN